MAELCTERFYDANANGVNDDGDLPIVGWAIRISGDRDLVQFTPDCSMVTPGDYTVAAAAAVEPDWFPTTPRSVAVTLADGDHKTISFGILCLGGGGGHTLGFWSNKNGQAMVGADNLSQMAGLNLRNAAGGNFAPGTYTAYRSWVSTATATNMAYMLSAQLSAMKLNVYNGLVSGDALIHAPGAVTANALGFATVSAVIDEASAELGAHGVVLAGSPHRAYQEALKNALDRANNNQTFVASTPCPFSFVE
jgi:hypothetical protein